MRGIKSLIFVVVALFATTSIAMERVRRFEGRTRLQTQELIADVEISFHDEAAIIVAVIGDEEVRNTIDFNNNADVVLIATKAEGHPMFEKPGQIDVFVGLGTQAKIGNVKASNGGRVTIAAGLTESEFLQIINAPWQKPAEVVPQSLPKVMIKIPRNTKMFLDAKAGEWAIRGSHTDMQTIFGDYYKDDVRKFKVNCHNSHEFLKLKLEGKFNPDPSVSHTWKFARPPWKFES